VCTRTRYAVPNRHPRVAVDAESWMDTPTGSEAITVMQRSITLIKFTHILIFCFLSSMLGALLYEVLVDRITSLTWIAVLLFIGEGIILRMNEWRCPLTSYAEKLGSAHGQVTDLLLPRWIADRVFQIYGSLFALALLLLLIRFLK
jgi:hypothetical protein